MVEKILFWVVCFNLIILLEVLYYLYKIIICYYEIKCIIYISVFWIILIVFIVKVEFVDKLIIIVWN